MKKAAIFLILFLIFASFVWGQQATFTWTGGNNDTNWDEPDNWSCDIIVFDGTNYPGENIGDIVVINDSAAVVLNVALTYDLDSLTIDDNASLDVGIFSPTVNSLNLINGAALTGNLTADNITIDDSSELNDTISFSVDGVLEIVSGVANITGSDIVFGNLDLGSRDIDVVQTGAGGITQTPTTVIKTSGKLLLTAEEIIELKEANEVTKLEIIRADKTVEFENNSALEVVGVKADDDVTITIVSLTDSITINGEFSAKDLTLDPGTAGVQMGSADITLTGNFDTKNTKLTLNGSGASSIEAVNISTGSIDVTSAAIINFNAASITTTGNQDYGNGTVTLTGTTTLTAAGGSITANGKVTGTGVTVNALHGISFTDAANALTGNITLNNTQSGAASGDIIFKNTSAPSSLTAKNNTANGKITINQTGNITITLLETTGASGSVSIETAGNVTQTGAITTNSLIVKAGTSITLNQTNEVTASVDLSTSGAGNIVFDNARPSAGNLTVTASAYNGNVTIKENTGGLVVDGIDAVGNTVSLDAAGSITQASATDIKAAALIVAGSANITLNLINKITSSVDFTSAGNIEFVNKSVDTGNLSVKTNTTGNIKIKEESGGLIVDQITTGGNVDLEANIDIETKDITVTGIVNLKAGNDIAAEKIVTKDTSLTPSFNANNKVTLEAEGKITVTDVIAYQLIATATDIVTVNTVNISENTGFEGKNAAIYIEAKNFVVKASSPPLPIVPGEPGGQLCLILGEKWKDINNDIVDGPEDKFPFGTGLVSGARWHQYFIDLEGMHLVYGEEPPGFSLDPDDYVLVKNDNIKTKFVLDPGYDIYIYNADITDENTGGLTFETSGEGIINIGGTNKFTKLTLETDLKDIILENIDIVSDITVKVKTNGTGTIKINQDITTTGMQDYTGTVVLVQDVMLTSTSTDESITLGNITGGGNSLTINGNGVLNGGSGIENLSVNGSTTINADITAVTQTYTGAVTLDGTGTRTLTGTTVRLGQFTGPGTGLSLAIAGNGILSGGSGINALTVNGTTTINGNITAGTQTYLQAVTLGGDVTLTSTAGSVTLGIITGGGRSLTITGNGVLNGGSGIDVLSVSGTATINADIDTTGNQTYTGAATLNGSALEITSQNGEILFGNTLTSSTGEIKLIAKGSGKNITITGNTTAQQLIVKTQNGVVSVGAISINSTNHGYEGENAAIYIVADRFVVTAPAANSIVPGGTGGQLCLNLNIKWTNPNNVVNGAEDNSENLGSVPNARWHQHFMVIGKILYSFTEDSNGNGKLDRIRVQTNKELLGNFTDFEVNVVGYKVTNYELVNNNNDSFYIYLEEKSEFDGDETPHWSITRNTSLIDATNTPMTDNPEMEYIDTIPPRIVYTLTLPGHSRTYVQLSEPVQTSAGVNISAGDVSFDGRTVTEVTPIALGYLFEYSASYKAEDLANLTNIDSAITDVGYFQMNNIVDKGKVPSKIEPGYPPKYPLDWSYTAYADNSPLIPPNNLLGVLTKTNNDPVIRRVTDVLVSLSSNNYFAWPVWAKPSDDNISIMDFDGSKYLEKASIEKSGIEIQARIGNNLTITPQLFWTTADIPAGMRNPKEASDAKKTGGLWLPNELTNPLYYYVPLSDGINPTPPAANSASPLFNYDIAADKLANSGAKFEFIFRSSSAPDLFIARLDAPANTIPSNWYTLIRPFSFNIQGIRYQRGGVTVLNNVINSDNKETAYIRYELPRAGRVTIQIYTLDGTLIKSIRRNENREAGAYVDSWDGSNNGGRAVARGMYFVRVVGPDIDEIRKIMVVK